MLCCLVYTAKSHYYIIIIITIIISNRNKHMGKIFWSIFYTSLLYKSYGT